MEEQTNLDFNFWPSFADLMLAFVLILVLVMFVFVAVVSVGTVNLSEVQKNQKNMIEAIGKSYGVEPIALGKDAFGISEEVDHWNKNKSDKSIIFTNRFDEPFSPRPSVNGIGVAIGNVASHETGHLMGLEHVADAASDDCI